jgi:hypothetical protein
VQVHPDAEGARRFGGEPKTEMWCVLDVNPARFFRGLSRGGPPRLEEALAGKRSRMCSIRVRWRRATRCMSRRRFMRLTRLPAVEIQQQLHTTYRIFDWDRRGPDVPARELTERRLYGDSLDDRDR